jgi:hypothetical protein
VESERSKAIACRPKRAVLNRVDCLVIMATVAIFGTVVAVNNPHRARAESRTPLLTSSDLPEPMGRAALDPALVKARIALALHQM